MIRAAALGAILCLRAAAQGPACAVSGTVVDSANKPVGKARVLAAGPNYSLWKSTDKSGFFCFDHIEPGSYRLSVEKAGYISAHRRVTIDPEDQSARPPLRIAISAEAAISGVVLDSDGEPIPGAAVSVWTRARTAKGFTPNSEEGADTGPDGAFSFSDLSPGVYYLSASHKDALQRGVVFPILDSQGRAPSEIEMETFYGGSLTFAGATPLTLKPGQNVNNLILMVRKTAVRRLAGRANAPPSMASLILHEDTETSSNSGGIIPIGADGSFSRDGLAPARYTLRLMDGGKTLAKQQVDLTNGDAHGIALERVETVSITMTFRIEGKGPAFHAPLDPMIFLEGTDDASVGQFQPDGTVRFEDVEPAIYSCEIPLGRQKLYVKQVTFDGQVQTGNQVDVRSGKPGVIEVTLSAAVAQVEGRVLAPEGDEETTVILVPDGEAAIAKQVVADEKGKFKMEAVPPGKYRMFAVQDFDEDLWGIPELSEKLAAKGVQVELKENESKSVTLRAICCGAGS